MRRYFLRMKGATRNSAKRPLGEILWSWLCSFLGIYAIWLVNGWLGIQEDENLYLIGSFGASAVLVYGAPAAELSQPRNLVGGHLVSALAGVIAYKLFPHAPGLAGALAVSVAIAGMHVTQTLHPPGGATALIAVIGGDGIHGLGFLYLFTPVLTGVLIMLVIAVVVNNFSSSQARHYPRHWC